MKKYLSLFLVLVMLVTSMPVYAFADGGDAAGEEIVSVAETTEESAEDKPAEDTKEEKAEKKEEPKAEPAKEEKAEEKPEPVKEEPKEEPKEESAPAKEETPAEVKTEEEPAPAKEEAPAEEKVEEEPAPVKEEAPAEEKTEEESAPVKEETVTEEETEAPAEDEVVTEEETEEPAEDEAVTEEETEAPAEDEVVTEEETEAPAEEEVLFEGMPIDEDGDGVADGFDVDGDGVIDMLMDGTEVLAKGEEDALLSKGSYPYVAELRLAEQTDRAATLKWDDLKDEDGYLIEYIESDRVSGSTWNPSYIKGMPVDADETSATIEDLAIGKSYRFRIRAWYDDGSEKGQYSEPTVMGDDLYFRPYPPKNLVTKTYSGTAIDLYWEAPDPGEDLVTGYYIVRSNDIDDNTLTKRLTVKECTKEEDGKTVLTWRDKNAQIGVTYTYEVYSSTKIKTDTYVESEKATKRQHTAQLQPPTGLTVHPHTTNSIKLTWDEVDGASYYKVYRKLAEDTNFGEAIGTAKKAEYPSYIDDHDVDPGIEYMYAVTAVASVTITGDSVDEETGETIPGVTADYESAKCEGVTGRTYPPVPSGVKVLDVGDSFIEIGWDKVAGATGYLLYASDDGETYEQIKEISSPDSLSYLDDKLDVGATRFYMLQSYVRFVTPMGSMQVVSCNEKGEQVFSKPISATTLPLAPEEVVLTNPASYNQIQVTWTESVGARGYYVLRSASSKTTPSEIVATIDNPAPTTEIDGVPALSWIDNTGLTCGTTYYYRVQPYVRSTVGGKLLVGGASATVSLKAMPAVPTNLVGELVEGTNTVQLSWDRVEGATGYCVYAAQDGGSMKQVATVKGVMDEVITYTVTGLTLYSEYEFAVAAYRESGDKKYTGERCEPTEPILIDFYAPGVNEDGTLNFIAEPQSKSKVTLSWKKAEGATGYELIVKEKNSGETIYSKKLTTTTTTLSGFDCTVDYVAELRLYRKVDGVYQYSDPTVLEFNTSPAKPSKLTVKVNPDGSGVNLTWTAVSEADGYMVKRSTDKAGNENLETIMKPQTAELGVKFTDVDVEPGMRYYYHVYSYVDTSCSSHNAMHISAPVTATALHLPGKVLELKVIGQGATAALLTWEPVEAADGYAVYQMKGDGSYKQIYEGSVDENGDGLCEYLAEELKGGSKYTFKVRAYTEAYDGSTAYGAYSSTVSIKPAPWPPESVKAVGSQAKRVYLSWPASEGATSYKVYYELADGQKKYISTVKSKAEYGEEVTATVKGLKYDTEYTFYVQAGASSAYGEYSEPSNAIKTKLGYVQDFAYKSSSSTQLKLSWTALPDVSGYEIERKGADESTWALIKSPGKDAKSYTVSGMTLGEKEDFRIRGYVTVDGARQYRDGNDGWVEIDRAYTLPSKPGNFRGAASGSDWLKFKWNAVANADGYVIYWENKNDESDCGSYDLKGGDEIEYTITGLESFTTYKVYVRAYVFDSSEENLGTKTGTISRKTAK